MLKKISPAQKFAPSPTEWELTFEDDFDFLDLTKWKYNTAIDTEHPEKNGIRRAAFNVNDPDVVFVEDGKLHIRTLWKNGSRGEGWYTAMLETSRIHPEYKPCADYIGFSQIEGYFEVRCKPAKAIGIWSAFWLMPDNNIAFSDEDVQWSGADGVEIDVMESPHAFHLFEKAKNQNIHVIHADGYDEQLKSISSPAFHVPNMYTEFHTYGLLWEKDKYTFFVDGCKTWETTHTYNGREMGICKVPEYLLLSTEVSGSIENGVYRPGLVRNKKTGKLERFWCGSPERNDKTKAYDFVVDYVRCYQKRTGT